MPVEDRAADTWEPLVAVADAAGGHWPTTARAAVLNSATSDDDPADVSLRVRLLIDCRTAFGDAIGLPTSTLLDRLRADDEAPWATLAGAGLGPRTLASLLRDFSITSATRRGPDSSQSKGYVPDDFADSWRRYCPAPRVGHLSVPSSTSPAVCITCRNPLSYDDGTHTHPTCTTATERN